MIIIKDITPLIKYEHLKAPMTAMSKFCLTYFAPSIQSGQIETLNPALVYILIDFLNNLIINCDIEFLTELFDGVC